MINLMIDLMIDLRIDLRIDRPTSVSILRLGLLMVAVKMGPTQRVLVRRCGPSFVFFLRFLSFFFFSPALLLPLSNGYVPKDL